MWLRNIKKYIVYGVIAFIAVVIQQFPQEFSLLKEGAAEGRLLSAWENRESKVWLSLDAEVIKNLADDREGDRHQRFLIDAGIGRSVLVAHNIDLAERVPVKSGTKISLSGRYEWNSKGGVIHWTHHDPSGRKKGGWIKVDGIRYH